MFDRCGTRTHATFVTRKLCQGITLTWRHNRSANLSVDVEGTAMYEIHNPSSDMVEDKNSAKRNLWLHSALEATWRAAVSAYTKGRFRRTVLFRSWRVAELYLDLRRALGHQTVRELGKVL